MNNQPQQQYLPLDTECLSPKGQLIVKEFNITEFLAIPARCKVGVIGSIFPINKGGGSYDTEFYSIYNGHLRHLVGCDLSVTERGYLLRYNKKNNTNYVVPRM